MDRLTRKEIETLIDDLILAHPIYTPQLRALRDQSLSQEAVRDEVLNEGFAQGKEAAAKVWEAAIDELDITDDVLKVDDYFKGFKAAVEARARAIRALKREPNAAGPVAKGECCCAIHHANYGRCLQCPIHGTPPPERP